MITRAQFAEEERRMKRLRKQGWTKDMIKNWLKGWRQPAPATNVSRR